MESNEIRTQKARGIYALSVAGFAVPKFRVAGTLAAFLFYWQQFKNDFGFDAFCRPCPMLPRHGFVGSRVVRSESEVNALWNASVAEDSNAEVVLMPPVDAAWSAIVSDDQVAISEGNDGATGSRRSRKIFLAARLANLPRTQAGLADNDKVAAFVEVVADASKVYVVQLRAGERIARTLDFVPQAVTVKHIENPLNYSDTQWEHAVKNFKPGTVVYASGACMTSHAAIHAKMSGVPFVTTYKPSVGMKLKVSCERTFHADVLRGLGLPLSADDTKKALRVVLFGLHNSIALTASPSGAFVLGAALNFACRLGTAACLGELRHNQHKGLSRSEVYAEAFAMWPDSSLRLCAASKNFATKKWSSGFGGKAWNDCTNKTIALINALTAYVRTPNSKTLGQAVIKLNDVVHASHNGGTFLTKFGSMDLFNGAAINDASFILRTLPALREIVDADADDVWERERALKPYTTPKGKLIAVQIRTLDASGSVRVQIRFKPVNGPSTYAEKQICVAVEIWEAFKVAEANAHATSKSFANSGAFYLPVDCTGTRWTVAGTHTNAGTLADVKPFLAEAVDALL